MMSLKGKVTKLKVRHMAKTMARRLPLKLWLGIGLVAASMGVALLYVSVSNNMYDLSDAHRKLLGASGVKPSDVKQTSTAFTYNMAEALRDDPARNLVASASKSDSTSEIPYQASLPKDASEGVTFGDASGDLSFNIVPNQPSMSGRYEEGRVVYPSATGKKNIYTFKRNGIKEDIILDRALDKVAQYSWRLELGDKLAAKMLPDGGIGIFSADPALYGDLQIADQKSQQLIDKARKNGEKNHLVFALPAPFIVDVDGRKNVEDVSYRLEGNTVTLEARNLLSKKYPLSIDPTVVVTTTADFHIGSDDGMVDYNTANQITRKATSLGSTGTFTTNTNYFSFDRSGLSSVAYNGYLYVVGGTLSVSGTNCKDTGSAFSCNDVQYAAINSDGSIGTWTTDGDYFASPRSFQSVVAYNGYLYVIGGLLESSSTNCKDSGNSNVCNDVQYAVINGDGSIGSFTTNTTHFAYPRASLGATAYNGYIYIVGGNQTNTDANCKDSGSSSSCNDIQYAPIRADGSVGTFTTNSTHFLYPRSNHSIAVYNGYLYVLGGLQSNSDTNCKNSGSSQYCNDVQYAAINSDGSVASWVTTSYFSFVRNGHTSVAQNGYLYVIGGRQPTSDTNCKNSGTAARCNDVQYAPLYGDGTAGTWATNTNYFSTYRTSHASVAYNNYVYVIGGQETASDTACKSSGTSNACNDVQYAALNTGTPTEGDIALIGNTTRYFNEPRATAAMVAYNGYLYIAGGGVSAATTNCKDTGSSTVCNDVQYAQIGASGSLGTYTTNTNYFSTPRSGLSAFAYNGYFYVVGGNSMNDVQYATVNSDGSLGTFTTNSTTFSNGRSSQAAFAYNGYLYVVGGALSGSSTACKDAGTSTVCNDVQYAQINSDGSVGSFTTNTNYFSFPRSAHIAFAYNGYLYVAGGALATASTNCKDTGISMTPCNDIQYAVINGDGSIGTFTTNANYFNFPRSRLAGFAQNGYFYVAGGFQSTNDTLCKDTGVTSRYCNDVLYGAISSADGSVGVMTNASSYFIEPRQVGAWVVYNGTLYLAGGLIPTNGTACKDTGTSQYCNDTQSGGISSIGQKAIYEKIFDVGDSGTNVRLNSVTYNGSSVCGTALLYRTAGGDGVFGAAATKDLIAPGAAVTIDQANKRYLYVRYMMLDEGCGTQSTITDITLNWQYDPPDAPTLNIPADGAFGVSNQPSFQMRSPQANNSYLRYKIDVCSTSNCSSIVRTIDQTASQTGWTGQDQQTSTAYTGNASITSSTMADHSYQTPALSFNTQYWWRAYAIDPAKSNTFSAATGIRTFYTNFSPTVPTLTSPANNSSNIDVAPDLRISSTDQDGDYVRYKIDICSTSNCSVIVRTIDQTASQTGWQGQSAQSGTAYTSGQEASHVYQPTELNVSTQYWWRAYAIDPGGTNAFSAASAISTFTTGTSPGINVNLRGGTTIKGGTSL